MGHDGIALEAFMHGTTRLFVHICFLFNIFLRCQYLPNEFMRSIFVPLVKCKSGDISDISTPCKKIKLITAMHCSHENNGCQLFGTKGLHHHNGLGPPDQMGKSALPRSLNMHAQL